MKKLSIITDQINDYFLKLSPPEAKKLFGMANALARRKGMIIFDNKGEPRPVGIANRPWVISRQQARYFHGICLEFKAALKKLINIYRDSAEAREIIPLSQEEEEWMRLVIEKGRLHPQSIFDRIDANARFDRPDWRESFRFIEPNSVGIGGVHYIPAACDVNRGAYLSRFKRRIKDADFGMQTDVRDLLLAQIVEHARAIGIGRRPKIAFVEDQSGASGTHEFEFVVEYFREKGFDAYLTDPRYLYLKGGEIHFNGNCIDILYRDCEIEELIDIERREGAPMDAVKTAFVRNQVISSIAGEFDHKSGFEIFADPRFKKYFTSRQHEIFKSHIPWTRLIWERKTQSPRGKGVDLVRYIRKNKDVLVMKPNREYGGKDVVLGAFVSQPAWERSLERAISNPSTTIAQELLEIEKEPFPVLSKNGRVRIRDFYTVSAFVATHRGIAVLGRFSEEMVVNVSRKGGLIPVYLVDS